jgi:archaellum biogenesis ATPase FlaH
MEIPEEYTVTHRDEPFLLYNNGIDSPARILIFSTETNLRALTTSISNTMTKQKIIITTLNQQILWSMVYLNTIPIRNLSCWAVCFRTVSNSCADDLLGCLLQNS